LRVPALEFDCCAGVFLLTHWVENSDGARRVYLISCVPLAAPSEQFQGKALFKQAREQHLFFIKKKARSGFVASLLWWV
jgi:hypothetical protein